MAGAGEGEFVVFDVFGNRATCAGCNFVAEGNGGDQDAVGADTHFVADDGFVFVHAVVVGNDCACAEVGFAADFGIADVGEVVGFGAFADGGVFDFDEVADVYVV